MNATTTEIVDLSPLLHGNRSVTDILLVQPTTEWIDDVVTAELILDCKCELGEGVIYDDQSNSVLWTDILKRQFHKLQLSGNSNEVNATSKCNNDSSTNNPDTSNTATAVHTVYELPKMLGSFGMLEIQQEQRQPMDDDSKPPETESRSLPLLCAWEDGFQLYDVALGRELSSMSIGEPVNPQKLPSRLNDGRVDPTGVRFICGGFHGGLPDVYMKVYKVEQKQQDPCNNTTTTSATSPVSLLTHEAIVQSITTTNSICWSNDGNLMYLADSPTKQIHSYRYNKENGTLSDKKLVHSKPSNEVGVPDGSCIDTDGFIWNAVWNAGVKQSCVQRIDPTSGLVVFTVHIPDGTSQVTCCCWGGPNLDVLFITSAAESTDPNKEPHAGGLYAVKLPFHGHKENRLTFTY